MSCIRWDRSLDPELHDFYAKKLLEPGWAGELTLAEAEYIRHRLEQDSRLRRLWHIRRRKVPLSLVVEKAYPEDPTAARRHIQAEQARARRKMPFFGQNVACADTVATKTGGGVRESTSGAMP